MKPLAKDIWAAPEANRDARASRPFANHPGWERHDMAISIIASAFFPACLASGLVRRGRDAPGQPLVRDAYARARSSAAMIYQLPG
ncbi:hypothetical protein MKP08_00010 [Erythrobacter sp. LQ02-29]|uniref:hypothetical protein n=1 Tax=Erythrobacter sp. LQ02-29 TaxID=2920384 RepID=UPI001F4E3CF7|nr:hypothetical protein [Erythrobacter sp. LQ02-29]MCP9221139.1 hypothetical protein [Erythrobacter sp. LQ02-29]